MKRAFGSVDGVGEGTDQGTNDMVVLNVGGTECWTTRHTLTNRDFFPDSLLARMFGNEDKLPRDAHQRYCIDADPLTFRRVLNVLRRPALAKHVPLDMSAEEWCAELDYWGLVPRDAVTGASTQPAGGTITTDGGGSADQTLEALGAAIRRDIMATERQVVRTLFAATGYDRQDGKTRTVSLRVPMGEYAMPWHNNAPADADLGTYLWKNRVVIASLLRRMLRLEGENAVLMHESKTPTHHVHYTFNGKPYSTQAPTLTVTLHYDNLDTVSLREVSPTCKKDTVQ